MRLHFSNSQHNHEVYRDSGDMPYAVDPAPSKGANVFSVTAFIGGGNTPLTIGYVHKNPHGWFANGPDDANRAWTFGNFHCDTKLEAIATVARLTLRR